MGKNQIRYLLFVVGFSLIAGGLLAQGTPPPPPPPPSPPPEIPLDGGVLFLLISGLFYGAKRLYGKNPEQ